MLLNHFRLREDPFGVTPDPRYLFETKGHREALASLIYGINAGRGFLGLFAQPGMGKTTLLNKLLGDIGPNARTAFLFQTQCTPRELLQYLISDLEIPDAGSDIVTMHRRLNEVLTDDAKAGRKCIVVIDEAQNLDDDVLETIRLLSDFETTGRKLIQVVLAGQPVLAKKLGEPQQEQMRQRFSSISWLTPLGHAEVPEYIDHRLRVAGHRGGRLFEPEAESLIAERSAGIPRNINNLCFNSMSICCSEGRGIVSATMVQEVLSDLSLEEPWSKQRAAEQSILNELRVARVAEAPRPAEPPNVPEQRPYSIPTRPAASFGSAGWTAAASSRQATAPKLFYEERTAPRPALAPTPKAGPRVVSNARARSGGGSRYLVGRDVGKLLGITLAGVLGLASVLFVSWTAKNKLTENATQSPATSSPADEKTDPAGAVSGAPSYNIPESSTPPAASSSDSKRPVESATPTPGSETRHTKTQPVESQSPEPALEPSMGTFSRNSEVPGPVDPPDLNMRPSNIASRSVPRPLVADDYSGTSVALIGIASDSAATRLARGGGSPKPTLAEKPRVSQIDPGTPLVMVQPTYPTAAKATHLYGDVILAVNVGESGEVRGVDVVSGNPILAAAAKDAVMRWKYRPSYLAGSPVATVFEVRVTFRENR